MDETRHRLLARWLPAAGIGIPFLCAMLAHAVGPQPAPVAAAPRRPALAFDQYLVDLGQVAPSQEVLAHFDFTNRGAGPVVIKELVPSCGCLQPQMKKKAYQPDESGHFTVHVQTANENPGLKEYRVTVKYADPQPREANVVFRVVLPENQVQIRPKALILGRIGSASNMREIDPQTIEITDRRDRHMNITRVECTRSFVAVQLLDSQIDEEGHWHGYLKVAVPGQIPAGRVEALVRIFTDDSDYPMLRVPLLIESVAPHKFVDPNVQTIGGTK